METNNQKNDQNIIPNDADKQQKGVNVPNLRFSEFNNYYSKCILDDIADVTKLAGFEFTKYVTYNEHGSIIALRGLNCKDGRLILDDVKFIDNSNLKMLKRSKLYINDILFTYVGTVGETAIITENDKYYLAPNVARIRLKTNQFNAIYLQELLNTNKFKQKIISPLIATSSQPALTIENIRLFKLKLPNIYEQTKVAEFFTIINARIDTQSKIIEDLELFKKGIENQYFSCNKDNEYVILGDVITQINNRNEKNIDFEVLSVSNKYGFIPQSEQFDDHEVASANKSNYKIVKQNDFAYNPARINVGSIAMLRNNQVGIVSPMYICFRAHNNRILSSYLDHFSHSNKFNNEVLKNLEGSVRLCLSFESLSKIKIHLQSLDTQYEIVKNLDLISNKISIENKILEKLKEQKKYLLSNMFI